MIVLNADESADFRVGYRAGWRAGLRRTSVAPAEYYGDSWSKWTRIGWAIGNSDALHDLTKAQAGERMRLLGLPVEANPWLPDEDGHAAFLTAWAAAQPGQLRWAVAP